MLSISEATKIVRDAFPNATYGPHIEYENLFIFQVFLDLPGEEGMDPFFSVDRDTGNLRDFSIYDDGDALEIVRLFQKAERR